MSAISLQVTQHSNMIWKKQTNYIYKCGIYLEPSTIEEKLQKGKKWEIHVSITAILKELTTHQTRYKEHIYCQSYYL
jgi:hypothetical protein